MRREPGGALDSLPPPLASSPSNQMHMPRKRPSSACVGSLYPSRTPEGLSNDQRIHNLALILAEQQETIQELRTRNQELEEEVAAAMSERREAQEEQKKERSWKQLVEQDVKQVRACR